MCARGASKLFSLLLFPQRHLNSKQKIVFAILLPDIKMVKRVGFLFLLVVAFSIFSSHGEIMMGEGDMGGENETSYQLSL